MKTLIVFIAVLSGTALAQYQDAPIPFEDEAPVTPLAPLPQRENVNVNDSDDFSAFVHYKETKFRPLSYQDDPSVGLSVGIHGGVIWLNEAKPGSLVRLALGARLTWEWSRIFLEDEYWRKVFFVDIVWNITQASAGTELVHTKFTHNYLAFAPALSFPIAKDLFALFVQGGIGCLFLNSTLTMDYSTPIESKTKGMFLFGQYGAGLRSRISPDPQKPMFIVLRAELTGFIHRYSHELMVSAGVGIGF